ncbi:hypothetical protein Tco_0974590 [Tanacetum coccineum]|uniref:Uncharacterized protein n=1 Tax=Tanacetum coccineum TaxID=301880 RepID=A0ABQ5EC19_9ASTR
MDNNRSDNMREGLGDPPATRVNLEAVYAHMNSSQSMVSGSLKTKTTRVLSNPSSTIRDGVDRGTTTVSSSYSNLGEISINPSMVSSSIGFGESNRAQNPNSGKPVTRFGDFADIMNAPSNVIPQQHQDVGVPLSNTIGSAAPFGLINETNVKTLFGDEIQDEVNKAGATQLSSSPKVSTSSPLVSLSTTINVPRELNSIDVAATFGVPLTTVGDLNKLINDIKADIVDNPSVMASPNVSNTNDNLGGKAPPSDPIVQYVDISKSYVGAAGASVKEQPNVISKFCPLLADPVYDGVNISIPRKVVEKGRSSFARCLIEVNSEANLVDVVTIGIPSLTGDDFTKETICVDPPVVTTSNVVSPTVEKTNNGFQTVGKKKKRKGKSKSINGGQFDGPSIKQIVRYKPKTTLSAPKKGTTNVSNPSTLSSMLKTVENFPKKDNFTTSNSFSALNDEEEDDEEVENVYNESANLFKINESSCFTAAAG